MICYGPIREGVMRGRGVIEEPPRVKKVKANRKYKKKRKGRDGDKGA